MGGLAVPPAGGGTDLHFGDLEWGIVTVSWCLEASLERKGFQSEEVAESEG